MGKNQGLYRQRSGLPPNHFESSIYSREKVGQSPNLFGSGILHLRGEI
jgi:hypothetical protein